MQDINRRRSIYTQLLWLLLASALVSGVLFGLLHLCGQSLIDYCLYETDYVEDKNQSYVEKLQKYINENDLSSNDTPQLKSWVETQKILDVQIYKNNIQTFDSNYPDQDIWEEEIEAVNYGWISYRPIQFSDGAAEIVISGFYGYQLNNYALIINIALSFSLFLLLVFLGIHRKMKYITRLSHEIEILEGGQLDYEITVQGKDELARLSKGLNDMRLSFQGLIENEAQMVQENQRIITEMSHDIRTPITSLMLYIEILKKGQYKDDEQLKSYIEKLEQNALRLKQLTDHLFEYTLTSGEKEIELEEPEDVRLIFFDLFSETCNYLNQQGFKVEFSADFPDEKLRVSADYVMRIMDNITSNIIKYADPAYPIRITTAGASADTNEHSFIVVFENRIRTTDDKVESTGIGLKNIENMMHKMNGSCKTDLGNDTFSISLYFPFC